MTFSERKLWHHLQRKQLLGVDFHRQSPLDKYIVDFYAPDLYLVIEIDGLTHDVPERNRKDVERQRRLEELGVQVLRFEDSEVRRDIWAVLDMIEAWILSNYPEIEGLPP
jgi:very-short-patch-repair endonuclease